MSIKSNNPASTPVIGATATESLTAAVESLFDNPSSKADKRGEQAYRDLQDTLVSKMMRYLDILAKNPKNALEALVGDNFDKLESVGLNRLALTTLLASPNLKEHTASCIRVLIRESVMHELPLSSAGGMLAVRLADMFKPEQLPSNVRVRFLKINTKAELGALEYMAAMQLLLVAQRVGFYTLVQKTSTRVLDNSKYVPAYDVIKFKWDIDQKLKDYISKKTDIEPSTYVPVAKLRYSGHTAKYTRVQDDKFLKIVEALQKQEFCINTRIADNKALTVKLNRTFKGSSRQEEATKYITKKFMLSDQTYHFKAAYGPDNGRIYLSGYLIPAQAGARNWISEFADKRLIDEVGIKHINRKLASYDGKDMAKMPAKKSMEYYNYVDAKYCYDNNIPSGHFLGLDGILMGMQTHALLLQDAKQYYYCIHEDGRNLMAAELGLTKEEIKGGISPYSYGAGENTTIKGILAAAHDNGSVTHDIESLVYAPDFWERWEKSFNEYFPATYRLREFVRELVKASELGCRVDYTTWAGFNATITPLHNTATSHHTVMGHREYRRIAIKTGEFGSKLVAAIGHELDSSILVKLIEELVLKRGIQLKPVHDEYCVHANDGDILCEEFTKISHQLLDEGPTHLSEMLTEMFSDYCMLFGHISVGKIVAGTLTHDMIQCGIN